MDVFVLMHVHVLMVEYELKAVLGWYFYCCACACALWVHVVMGAALMRLRYACLCMLLWVTIFRLVLTLWGLRPNSHLLKYYFTVNINKFTFN